MRKPRVIFSTTGVLCETTLTDEEAGSILVDLDPTGEFLSSLASQWSEKRFFTRDQAVYAHRAAMNWINEQRDEKGQPSDPVRFPALLMLFARSIRTVRHPVARFLFGDGVISLFFKFAKDGGDTIYVNVADDSAKNFMGQIDLNGVYVGAKFSTQEVVDRLVEIDQDVPGALIQYAERFQNCPLCNMKIKAGTIINKACSKNWNVTIPVDKLTHL